MDRTTVTDEQICQEYCRLRGWKFFSVEANGERFNYGVPGVFTIMPLFYPVAEARRAIIEPENRKGEA